MEGHIPRSCEDFGHVTGARFSLADAVIANIPNLLTQTEIVAADEHTTASEMQSVSEPVNRPGDAE